MKIFEGEVTEQRVNSTGDYHKDYSYHVGYDSLDVINKEISKYEGSKIRVTIEMLIYSEGEE